jgi:hypothetical protein
MVPTDSGWMYFNFTKDPVEIAGSTSLKERERLAIGRSITSFQFFEREAVNFGILDTMKIRKVILLVVPFCLLFVAVCKGSSFSEAVGAYIATCRRQDRVSENVRVAETMGIEASSRLGRFLRGALERYGRDESFSPLRKEITRRIVSAENGTVRSPSPELIQLNFGIGRIRNTVMIDLKYLNLVSDSGALTFGENPTTRGTTFARVLTQTYLGIARAIQQMPDIDNIRINAPSVQNVNLWKVFRDMGMNADYVRSSTSNRFPIPVELRTWMEGVSGVNELQQTLLSLERRGIHVESMDFSQTLSVQKPQPKSYGDLQLPQIIPILR